MFKRLELRGKFIGYVFEQAHAFCFFGSRYVNKDDLRVYFPQFEFAFLKQVHGNQVIKADSTQMSQADGHFTKETGLAIVSQTADCAPILLISDQEVCALHAGWRGVASDIVHASKPTFSNPPALALIGPHIRKQSFEVGVDVAEQILRAKPEGRTDHEFLFTKPEHGKCRLDLTELIKAQLSHAFPGIEIHDPGDDTMTSQDFHSFRRDREKAGRQHSFVVLKR